MISLDGVFDMLSEVEKAGSGPDLSHDDWHAAVPLPDELLLVPLSLVLRY